MSHCSTVLSFPQQGGRTNMEATENKIEPATELTPGPKPVRYKKYLTPVIVFSLLTLVIVSFVVPLFAWAAPVQEYSYKVINTYPHDAKAFTQGLIFHKGRLIEGTGNYGNSHLREVDLKTGKIIKQLSLDQRYFGEGISVHGDEIFQLTWEEKTVFVYEAETLKYKRKSDITAKAGA